MPFFKINQPASNMPGIQVTSSNPTASDSSFLWTLAVKIKNFIARFFSYIFSFNNTQNVEPSSSLPSAFSSHSFYSSPKIQDIIATHKNGDKSSGCCGLSQLQSYSRNKNYQAIHSSHYDWWMFPINRSSSGKGDRFKLSSNDFKALSENKAFMKDYINGIRVVLNAWGWELDNGGENIGSRSQNWDGYGIRLAKMANSLQLFIKNSSGQEQRELTKAYQSLQLFYTTIVRPAKASCSMFNLVKKYCEN